MKMVTFKAFNSNISLGIEICILVIQKTIRPNIVMKNRKQDDSTRR